MLGTKIDYSDKVLEVTGGCTKCSSGCRICWAIKEVWRMAHNPLLGKKWQGLVEKKNGVLNWTGRIKCFDGALDAPLLRRKPTTYFVDSKADLFHPEVPFSFTDRVFNMMGACSQHTFLLLTKRPKQILSFIEEKGEFWYTLPNVHIGVSISIPDEIWKVTELKKIPAAFRWLSIEPLLEEVKFSYDRLFCDRDPDEDSPVACIPCPCGKHWQNGFLSGTTLNCIDCVVVGGESGPGARPMKHDWARSIRDQCLLANVPFFMKQMGGHPNKRSKLEEITEDLRIRDLIW